MPVRSRNKPPKLDALREEGTLNPTPDEVRDPKFLDNEFFDPHDIVQVKYEMLRRVSIENASVSAPPRSTAFRGRRTTKLRPASIKAVLLDWCRGSAVRVARINFKARRWHS